MKKVFNRYLAVLAFVGIPGALSGCGFLGTSEVQTEALKIPAPQALELFISRASMNETEFEQYKISAGKIFYECGQIRRGRFAPQNQDLVVLEPEAMENLNAESIELRAFLAESSGTFERPGKNASMFDPGQLYLTMKFPDEAKEIKTSLDSISTPSSEGETKVGELVRLIRGAAKNARCGNDSFYGLGQKASD